MKLILLSSNVSYSWHHLFFPHHEHLFKKVECPKTWPCSIKQWRWGARHSLFLHTPQYYGKSQNSPSNTKWFHCIWSTRSRQRGYCWLEEKNARVRHMRKIRRRVKLLVKLWVFFWNKNWTRLYCSVLHNFATANDVYRCQNWDDPSHDTIKVKMWCNNIKNGMNITCLYHMIPQ